VTHPQTASVAPTGRRTTAAAWPDPVFPGIDRRPEAASPERFRQLYRVRLGALVAGLVGLEGRRSWMIRPPDMDHDTDQHESDQQQLVKQ